MTGKDVLNGVLSLPDKWFLGGGRRVVWAPPFPVYLELPGFWDHGCYLSGAIEPIFSLAVLDRRGTPLRLRPREHDWNPARLALTHRGPGIQMIEERAVLATDTFVVRIRLSTTRKRALPVWVVLWTRQPDRPAGTVRTGDLAFVGDHLRYTQGQFPPQPAGPGAPPAGRAALAYACALGADREPHSWCVNVSEPGGPGPQWEMTPFYESMTEAGLPCEMKARGGIRPGGMLFLALAYPVDVPEEGEAAVVLAAAYGADPAEATANLQRTRDLDDPIQASSDAWAAWFDQVPSFECSDPFFQRYYWYRWYGLKLNRVEAGVDRMPYPCVFEGVNRGWFRHPISYSAQCHMVETRWMHDPALAQGSLLNFLENQEPNGWLPGGVLEAVNGPQHPGMYHANWGWAVRQVSAVHPDRQFLARVYGPLSRYAHYFDAERDREALGLYDVIDQGETGQEYMSRYLFADPRADGWGRIQLKGVDATVYIYELQRALAWIARRLDQPDDARAWSARADRTAAAINKYLWDPERGFYVDVRPADLARSPYTAAIGFYPMMTDLAAAEQVERLKAHLLSPEEFWTEFPVPASSRDDPNFDAFGRWKDKRHCCPWNGRTWLMTNSHVARALGRAAIDHDPGLRPVLVEFLTRFIRMLYLEGDLDRPSSYEYYNPLNGRAPIFRGVDDSMHSWVVDLILQFVAGIRPDEDGSVTIDPLPFPFERWRVERLRVQGHDLGVEFIRDPAAGERGGLTVRVDGRPCPAPPDGAPLTLKLPAR